MRYHFVRKLGNLSRRNISPEEIWPIASERLGVFCFHGGYNHGKLPRRSKELGCMNMVFDLEHWVGKENQLKTFIIIFKRRCVYLVCKEARTAPLVQVPRYQDHVIWRYCPLLLQCNGSVSISGYYHVKSHGTNRIISLFMCLFLALDVFGMANCV